MRKRIVAGNWKMNKTLKEGIELAKEIEQQADKLEDKSIGILIGPPFIHLSEVSKNNTKIIIPKPINKRGRKKITKV